MISLFTPSSSIVARNRGLLDMSGHFSKMRLPMTIDFAYKTRFRKDTLSARRGESVRGKAVEASQWACLKHNFPAHSTEKPGFYFVKGVGPFVVKNEHKEAAA